MNKEYLRESLKSGALRGVYAHIRRWKRRLQNEPLAGTVPVPAVIISAENLLPHVRLLATHSRFYFSLALEYIDLNTPEMDMGALACLRCADALEFESIERTALYRGQIFSRRGNHAAALECVQALLPYELTADEQQLREQILQQAESDIEAEKPNLEHDTEIVAQQSAIADARSLLVIGDTTGRSALLSPTVTYFLAAAPVNGLSAADIALLPLEFDLGLATETDRQAAEAVGVRCERWISIEWPDVPSQVLFY